MASNIPQGFWQLRLRHGSQAASVKAPSDLLGLYTRAHFVDGKRGAAFWHLLGLTFAIGIFMHNVHHRNKHEIEHKTGGHH